MEWLGTGMGRVDASLMHFRCGFRLERTRGRRLTFAYNVILLEVVRET
jgi:hypothetical protein